MSQSTFIDGAYSIHSPNITYDSTNHEIVSKYSYQTTIVKGTNVYPKTENLMFKTSTKVPKTGLLLVGLGGNNGTTIVGGIVANKLQLSWETKEGFVHANYFGSLTQASTVRLGLNEKGEHVHIPLKNMLPMVDPNDLVIHGWDISSNNMADAMKRAKVLDIDLQRQLHDHMKAIAPMPGIYSASFIAANQSDRADNVLTGNKKQNVDTIRKDIRDFKEKHVLDKVIVLWTANTERFCSIEEGINDTAANLLASIDRDEDEVSPSTLYAVASVLEGCPYINGSPQNTFVPGLIQLAEDHHVFIAGDDFKSGQTKIKSVLVDFLVSAGIKPASIVSYNHLGNNDGMNLSAPQQFRSKEISKSNVVDDMVSSNRILYKEDEHPDHCVVIKYVPYVGDSKRAMDEYTSEIFLGGKNTIIMHNTCEDSLLASPIILDLAILCEICDRITVKREDEDDSCYEKFYCILSLLSYLLKAPLVPSGTPVVNALASQRQSIINIFRACLALPPDNFMMLEHKLSSMMMRSTAINGAAQNGKHSHDSNGSAGVEVPVKRVEV